MPPAFLNVGQKGGGFINVNNLKRGNNKVEYAYSVRIMVDCECVSIRVVEVEIEDTSVLTDVSVIMLTREKAVE